MGGMARDEIVRELVREPKGSDGRSEKGVVGERGDPRAIDELRGRISVCRVLGVDPKVEGESVVPSNGVGSSATRVDWARVGAICRSWRDGEASEDDGANEADDANEADEANGADEADGADGADGADEADGADADDPKLTAAQERDLAIGRIGPRVVAVERASASGDMHLGDGPHGPNTSVSSRSNFCSFRADACVFGGRWQYEVTIRTGRAGTTQEHGVGERTRRAQGSQVERGVPALRPTVGPRRRHHVLHRPHRGRGRRGHGDLPSERRVHGGGVPECSTVATRPRVLPRRVPQRQRGDGPQLRDIAHAVPARGPRPADRRRRRGAGVAQIRRGVRATLRLRRRRRPGSVERDLPLRDVGEYVPAERDARASDAGRRGDARVRRAAGGGSLGVGSTRTTRCSRGGA